MSMDITDVDRVPALFAKHDGPTLAGLTFRVGQADETLARRGITHLLEHLVLHGHGLTDYHYNGSTGVVVTTFHLQGGEDDIVAYLNGVCASLQALPMHRLETERQVLRAEERGRSSGAADSLALWRYGARTYGLPAYGEMGLPRIGPDELQWWARTWFTRQNAVLWVAGERIPPALKLALPDGERRPVPAPTTALRGTPAYFCGDGNHVAYDGIVRRGTAGMVLSEVLERELYRSLRQEDGNSYTAATNYDPRGDGYAVVTAIADSVPDKQDAVLGGFVDVLAKLRAGRIEQADLDAVRAKAEDSLRGPMADVGRLPLRAFDLLTGASLRSVEEVREQLRAVTVADVHGAALEMLGSGLLQTPHGHDAEWAGFAPAPVSSERAIEGPRYPSVENPQIRLVVGASGVGLDREGRPPVSIPFDQCAVSLAHPDGGRQLIGVDSLTIRVEPTLFHIPPEALAHLDAALAPVTVPLPARDPEDIPVPSSPAPATVTAPPKSSNKVGLLVGAITSLVLAVLALCCGGLWTLIVNDNSDPDLDVPMDGFAAVVFVVTYGGFVALGILGVYLLRRRNRK
ncbi:M16 family metallopeptidase [Dactylosporangium sp. CS-047395]|uniref:M16 family metallopeptidase n=1 Tax=Dactylosporangium sp. CS-047395 TaxID=3239936 RepID=UPI003D934690